MGIVKLKENTIHVIAICHPSKNYSYKIAREIVKGRMTRMLGDLKRTKTRKKKDENGEILRDEKGRKVIEKEVIDVESYNVIPKFVEITRTTEMKKD